MKRYARKSPIIPNSFLILVSIVFLLITMYLQLFCEEDYEWCVYMQGITFITFFLLLCNMISTSGKYSLTDHCVQLFMLSVMYKKIKYTDYSSIVISNASYNNGFGFGVYTSIPMQYATKKIKEKTSFPYLSFLKSDFPTDRIASEMDSFDLFTLADGKIFCIGICWFDAFSELIEYIDYPVYILEDVYHRYKKEFDSILTSNIIVRDNIYIISGNDMLPM